MVFLTQAITQPDAPILKILSWIPPFTPFMMAARAGSGPPIWEVLGTASLMALVTAGEIWVASRAFKAGALSNARFDIKHFFASITGKAQV
jgi:ABC-2 type transport system permease protein